MTDNIWYVVRLTPNPPAFGWSRGPDTPDVGGDHDWPPQGSTGLHTFHWIRASDFTDLPDTQVDLNAVIGQGGTWKRQTRYAGETTGIWFITDMSRLMQTLRDRGLGVFADFLETSPRIPHFGDPSDAS